MGPEIVIVPSLFATIAYVFYVVASGFIRRQQIKATTDLQAKLLERIGTIGELGQFLDTDGGRRFLRTLSTEPMGGQAHQRVLRAFQSGIVMVCLGLGVFLYVGRVQLPYGAYENVGFVATVSTAVGLGLLISGYVSLRLSKRMGLITGAPPEPVAGEARSA